jgi:hypothetical protein
MRAPHFQNKVNSEKPIAPAPESISKLHGGHPTSVENDTLKQSSVADSHLFTPVIRPAGFVGALSGRRSCLGLSVNHLVEL